MLLTYRDIFCFVPKKYQKIGQKYLLVGKLVRKFGRRRETKAEEEEEEDGEKEQDFFRDLIGIQRLDLGLSSRCALLKTLLAFGL